MVRPIVIHPDPILEKVCKKVDTNATPDAKLIVDMVDTMKAAQGIGLAANQIGIDLSLFVMQTSDMTKPQVWANAICAASPGTTKSDMIEGCLSLPGQTAKVPRYDRVWLTGYTLYPWDVEWVLETLEFHGTQAQCVQHEIDHINGIVYPAHLDAAAFKRFTKKSRNFKDQGILNYPRGAISFPSP